MRIAPKAVGLLFLIWLGMHIWFIVVPIVAPNSKPPPGTFISLQEQLRGRAEARQAGPEALAAYLEKVERSKPFDNTLVITYALPLFLVWLVCAVGRARKVTPLAFVGALLLLWLAVTALVQTLLLLAPHVESIARFTSWLFSTLSDKKATQLVIVLIGLALMAVWRTPGFLLGGPRLIDGALRELVDEQDGWIAERHGARAAQAAHLALILVLGGIAGWVLWRACDGVDGGGLPGAFGTAARSGAVALGAALMIRTHLRV